MKRFLISMVALLAVVGCAKQDDLVSGGFGSANGPEFEVGFESSRVAIAEDGEGFKLTWSEGDLVSCFLSTGGNAKYIYAGEPGEAFGIIKPLDCPAGEALDAYYAAYPYTEGNALVDGKLSITLPAEQTYVEDTFGPNSNTMVAVNTDKEPYYTFSNMCGYVRLKVWGEATITSIEFKGNKEEVIAGAALADATAQSLEITGEGKTITLNCNEGVALGASEAEATEFWVVVPPMAFEGGFTVTLTDAEGQKMIKKLGTAFTIERNAVHEGKIAYEANADLKDGGILFDAKFNADGSAENAGTDKNLTIVSKFGAADAVVERAGMNVLTLNNILKNNSVLPDGYCWVDYSQNEIFKTRLTNGFTMEVLSRTIRYHGNYWSKPFAATTFCIHHGGMNAATWGFGANIHENQWVLRNKSAFGEKWLLPNNVNSYDHVLLTYDGAGNWTMVVNGVASETFHTDDAFAAGNALAIGAFPYTDGSAYHSFVGDIAIARIYDKAYTAEEAAARYADLEQTIAALNAAVPVVTPVQPQLEMLADIQFANDADGKPIATESINSLPIETKYKTTDQNLVIREAEGYTLNNVATFGDNETTMTYFNVDYAAIKETMKSEGFTIEVIHRDTRSAGVLENGWRGLFGSADFGLWLNPRFGTHQLDARMWDGATIEEDPFTGEISKDEWHYTTYAYNAQNNTIAAYTDGELMSYKKATWRESAHHMLAIGGRYFSSGNDLKYAWGGDIALFRIYKGAIDEAGIAYSYNELKANFEKLNLPAVELPVVPEEPDVEVPEFPALTAIADVQWTNNGEGKPVATDAAKGQTVETVYLGNKTQNLWVTDAPEGYTLNKIATFGKDEANMTYFSLSTLNVKPQIQNGFTIEAIHRRSHEKPWGENGWCALFGSRDYCLWISMIDGKKWEARIWDSAARNYSKNPVAADVWHHTVYIYNDETGKLQVYTDGVLEVDANVGKMRTITKSLLPIGARSFSGSDTIKYPWGGDIALFKMYDEAVNAEQVAAMYGNRKPEIAILSE